MTAMPTPDADERLAHLRGALRLLGAGVEAGVDIVEDMHRAISRAPLAVLAAIPETRPLARAHDGLRRGICKTIRGVSRLLFSAVDLTLAHAGPALAPSAAIPGPLVGVLHGIVGDGMDRDANPMRTTMHLRHDGHALTLTPAALARALPTASEHLVVFVHGLACDESSWQHASLRSWGRPDVSYAALLRAQGLTTLHLRYNSGLHIAANGRALATVLADLRAAYPVPLRALTLVGHSMGGLVVRSACHFGQLTDAAWTKRVHAVICLGSPHGGAPLERLGALATDALKRIAVTAAIGRAVDRRSAGIKDLGRGAVVDGDTPEALLPHARYHFIAGSYGHAPHRGPRGKLAHALGWLVGDGLVRVPSARHDHGPTHRVHGIHRIHLGGLHHMHLLNHPRVFHHIEAALRPVLALPGAITTDDRN